MTKVITFDESPRAKNAPKSRGKLGSADASKHPDKVGISHLVSDVSRATENSAVHTSETKWDIQPKKPKERTPEQKEITRQKTRETIRRKREEDRSGIAARAADIQAKSEARKAQALKRYGEKKEPEKLTVIQKRARRKTLQKSVLIALMELRSEREKKYRNSFYCNHAQTVEDGITTAGIQVVIEPDAATLAEWRRNHPDEHYPFRVQKDGGFCRRRWCNVCSSVMADQFIKKYLPVFEVFQSKRGVVMVTLTGPTVYGDELDNWLETMKRVLFRIIDSEKRKHLREPDKYNRLEGWRKTEATDRPPTPEDLAQKSEIRQLGKIHLHFHAIIHGTVEDGYKVVALWERGMKKEGVQIEAVKAQDVTECSGVDSLKELTKYVSKDMVKAGTTQDINRRAKKLDIIYGALEGTQVYSSFGFTLPKPTVEEMTEEAMVKDANPSNTQTDGEYYFSRSRWVNKIGGEELGAWNYKERECDKEAEKRMEAYERERSRSATSLPRGVQEASALPNLDDTDIPF